MSTLESARIWWRSKWPSANRPIIRLPSCNPNTSSVNLISGPRVNAPFQCCQLGFWGFYHISKVSGWFILKFIRQIACKYHYWICEFQDDSFTTSWDINQNPSEKVSPSQGRVNWALCPACPVTARWPHWPRSHSQATFEARGSLLCLAFGLSWLKVPI